MRTWLAREKKVTGWLAASVGPNALSFAHGRYVPSPAISAYGSRALPAEKQALQKIASEMHLERYQCATILRPGEYQLVLVEAPNVPPAELKSAMRWRLKDQIDYHVDDATLDVLDIPPEDATSSRAHMMYAVCARNEVIQSYIRTFQEAQIPLSVIDIVETAQRNIAALFEEAGRGCALVYFGEDAALLTINFRQELYLARRFEIPFRQFASGDEDARRESMERVALELQRTFDHFERQYPYVAVSRLLIAPMERDVGMAAVLEKNLTVPAQPIDLRSKLAFDGPGPELDMQWRLFHHFGAALRHEAKAL